jgi:hypothetical protein
MEEAPFRPNGLEPELARRVEPSSSLGTLEQTPPPGLLWQVVRQLTHQKLSHRPEVEALSVGVYCC